MCRRQAKSDRPKTKQIRERDRSGAKPIVAEVYSRPRVTACARMHYASEIIASKAYDTHTGYDFTDEKVRDAAKKEIDQTDTDVVVMSPPCTKFSSQQRSNETNKMKIVIRRQHRVATMHLDF